MVAAGIFAILDEDDFARLRVHTWHIDYRSNGVINRVRRNVRIDQKNRMVSMHHDVIGKPEGGFEVDHINRNPLDNRKENLRFATKKENMRNRIDSVGRISQAGNGYVVRLQYDTLEEAECAVQRYYAEEKLPSNVVFARFMK